MDKTVTAKRVLVLTALEIEARAVAAALDVRFIRGKALIASRPDGQIEIHTIGMRASRLPQVLPILISSPIDVVVVAGLGGGLDPTLRVGDLVLDLPEAPDDPPSFPRHLPIHVGRIHTAGQIIAMPAEKQALFQRTGALAIDMEQSHVRQALQSQRTRVIGLRAISDTAATAIDPTLGELVDEVGRPITAAVAKYLLRHPPALVRLARLGFASKQANRALSAGIRWLLSLDI